MVIAKTIEVPQAWMSKDEAMKYFGLTDKKSVFQKMLAEFKDLPQFKHGYRLLGHRTAVVNIKLFDEYLVYRAENLYK